MEDLWFDEWVEIPGLHAASDDSQRLLLTVEQAAARLGIGRTKMFELLRRGEVESVPVGRLRRVPTECLSEFVERLRASRSPWNPGA